MIRIGVEKKRTQRHTSLSQKACKTESPKKFLLSCICELKKTMQRAHLAPKSCGVRTTVHQIVATTQRAPQYKQTGVIRKVILMITQKNISQKCQLDRWSRNDWASPIAPKLAPRGLAIACKNRREHESQIKSFKTCLYEKI